MGGKKGGGGGYDFLEGKEGEGRGVFEEDGG